MDEPQKVFWNGKQIELKKIEHIELFRDIFDDLYITQQKIVNVNDLKKIMIDWAKAIKYGGVIGSTPAQLNWIMYVFDITEEDLK